MPPALTSSEYHRPDHGPRANSALPFGKHLGTVDDAIAQVIEFSRAQGNISAGQVPVPKRTALRPGRRIGPITPRTQLTMGRRPRLSH
jgi:hypothetical protein